MVDYEIEEGKDYVFVSYGKRFKGKLIKIYETGIFNKKIDEVWFLLDTREGLKKPVLFRWVTIDYIYEDGVI